jgi:hypothetical protein
VIVTIYVLLVLDLAVGVLWWWCLTSDGSWIRVNLRIYLGSELLKISKGTVSSPKGVVGTKSEKPEVGSGGNKSMSELLRSL